MGRSLSEVDPETNNNNEPTATTEDSETNSIINNHDNNFSQQQPSTTTTATGSAPNAVGLRQSFINNNNHNQSSNHQQDQLIFDHNRNLNLVEDEDKIIEHEEREKLLANVVSDHVDTTTTNAAGRHRQSVSPANCSNKSSGSDQVNFANLSPGLSLSSTVSSGDYALNDSSLMCNGASTTASASSGGPRYASTSPSQTGSGQATIVPNQPECGNNLHLVVVHPEHEHCEHHSDNQATQQRQHCNHTQVTPADPTNHHISYEQQQQQHDHQRDGSIHVEHSGQCSVRIGMFEIEENHGAQLNDQINYDPNNSVSQPGHQLNNGPFTYHHDLRKPTAGTRTIEQGGGDKLLSQLGRRVSLFPQLLVRRMSKTSKASSFEGSQFGSLEHNIGADNVSSRRFSLQNSSILLVPPRPPPSPPPPPDSEHLPPTTVTGVGGTITTVTRSKRKTAPLPRLVAKNGTVNLFLDNIDRRQYVKDLFTTMIDIKWRYNLLAAALGFVASWLFFACIWYSVLYMHNDLNHENDPTWSPCIVNVHSFPAALLFSIETQSTLGFGSRIISVECPGAIVIFCIQLIFGVVVECLIVGMVFAKLSRPAKRSQTIMFSKYATVGLRDGKMCLTFRVGDVRSKSHIIGATIRASLVSQKITEEGEIIPFYHYELDVKIDDSMNNLLLIWPLNIVHLIDETSPFYRLSAEQLANFKFEIITVLEGTVESTGQSIQVRSSYLPSEVKWGYRFEPIVSTHGFGRYAQTIIDYNKFNRIIQVDAPNCSPREYYSRKKPDQLENDSATQCA